MILTPLLPAILYIAWVYDERRKLLGRPSKILLQKYCNKSTIKEERSIKTNSETNGNRKYKDTVFRSYMSTPERVIEVYNAVYGTHLPPDTPVEFNTLEGVLYMNRVNDISCTIGNEFVVLIEHQSTDNQNMPLRLLLYVSRLYEKIIGSSSLYRRELIKIPAPKFIVCYNGDAPLPERDEMKLSSAFISESSSLELKTDVVNINYDADNPVLSASRSLSEYAQFIYTVREYTKTLPFDEAIKQAIIKCENSGVMEEFLRKNGSEVRNVLFEEWNQEEAERIAREEAHERACEETTRKHVLSLKGIIAPNVLADKFGLKVETILSIWNNATPAT